MPGHATGQVSKKSGSFAPYAGARLPGFRGSVIGYDDDTSGQGFFRTGLCAGPIGRGAGGE